MFDEYLWPSCSFGPGNDGLKIIVWVYKISNFVVERSDKQTFVVLPVRILVEMCHAIDELGTDSYLYAFNAVK